MKSRNGDGAAPLVSDRWARKLARSDKVLHPLYVDWFVVCAWEAALTGKSDITLNSVELPCCLRVPLLILYLHGGLPSALTEYCLRSSG